VTADGIPYLSPEICLLFKAKAVRDKEVADFEVALPPMPPVQRGLAAHRARAGASRSRVDFRYGMSRG